jgi:hypothetical protein
MHVPIRSLLLVPLAAALVALAGCKKENPNAPARLSGKVTHNGNLVTGGTITFHPKEGAPFQVGIGADGTYRAVDVPIGEAAVSIETESINPNAKKQEYRGSGMAGMYGKAGGGAAGAPKGKVNSKSPAPEGASMAGEYVKIPAKYADPAKSGLSVKLERGEQKKDFELTD